VLIASPDDALALLGLAAPIDRPTPHLPDNERLVWEALDGGYFEVDTLSVKCGLSTPECFAAITSLEIMGLVECSVGGEIRRR
jgi:predicted Rossmann fold nucleotide-binding protein DprA/Smf involved in DNA uptake